MGTAQDLFNRACNAYNNIIKILEMTDKAFQDIAYKNDPSKRYDTKVTLAQFDMILQGILLSVGCSDGDFDSTEVQFVDKITDYGDVLSYIKNETKGELALTWEVVARLNSETQQKLVSLMPHFLNKLCDSFVTPLALMDKVLKDVDILDMIQKGIAEIVYCMSALDGSADQNEVKAAAQMVVELIVMRWKKVLNS